MSIKLMDKVWELQSLSQPRKMLLLSIADHASDEGVAWPAVKTLMRKCSLKSESGTRRAINELVELGWLTKQERPRKVRKGKHQQDTNLYQINLVKLYEEAAIHEPVPRAPSKSSSHEPVRGDGSPHDGSQHEGSCGVKKGDYEPVPRTPDPSVKTDPSEVKDLSSQNSDESSDAQSKSDFLSKHPDAVVCSPKGNKWGTQQDLDCAGWIFSRIQELCKKLGVAAPKQPNWTDWANDVRLMREIDGHSHRDICALFKRANQDAFWCKNVLSPRKLRERWDELTLKLSSPGGAAGTSARKELDWDGTAWADKLIQEGIL